MAELPQNSVARYRGCTRKSILGFGRHPDLTVGDILKVEPDYIAWVYFNADKVTFSSDILEELNITNRIDKPGTDREAFYEWRKAKYAGMTDLQRMNAARQRQLGKKRMIKAINSAYRRSAPMSKGELQAANHGHRKLK